MPIRRCLFIDYIIIQINCQLSFLFIIFRVIALPDSYHSLEDNNGVDKRVSRFVAPISATIGRAGSSMYISTSCMFIIQLIGMEVHAATIILVM